MSEVLERLKTDIAGVSLEHPLINAAGFCKDIEGAHGFKTLLRSAVAAVLLGSITLEERAGNPGNVYHDADIASFNSLGLPNRGAKYYQQYLPEMARMARDANKPLIVSVAGFNADEFGQLTEIAFTGGATIVELNAGCPNVIKGGTRKPILAFHPDQMLVTLDTVQSAVGAEARVIVKLSPYSNPEDVVTIGDVLANHPLVKGIVHCNTFPQALSLDGNLEPHISVPDGLAGMAGPSLKYIALGNIVQMRNVMTKHQARKDLIGAGGIGTWQDVAEYQKCGAKVVQIGTALQRHGPKVFSTILEQCVAATMSGEEVWNRLGEAVGNLEQLHSTGATK